MREQYLVRCLLVLLLGAAFTGVHFTCLLGLCLFVAVGGVVLLTPRGRRRQLTRWWSSSPSLRTESAEAEPGWNLWFACGWSVFVFIVALLEAKQPLYFTQDDNYSQFLPIILQAGRSAFEGVFPNWNPLQYLGGPFTTVGVYSLTSPLTYAAYGVAHYFFLDDNWTMEVLVIGHLGLLFWACFSIAKRMKLSAPIAVASALSITFSGFNLIVGRSWYYMVTSGAWTAVAYYCFLGILAGRHQRAWAWATGISLGVLFHSGNAQLWTYTTLFIAIHFGYLWFTDEAQKKAWPSVLLAMAVSAVMVTPLLFIQMKETFHAERFPWGGGIGQGLWAMIAPYPFSAAPHPNGWDGGNKEVAPFMTQLYYSGTVFMAVCFGGVVWQVVRSLMVPQRKPSIPPVLAILFVISFVAALGSEGYLWNLAATLPPMNRFSNPLKFLLYVNFYGVLFGASLLDRVHFKKIASVTLDKWAAAVVVGLLVYHASISQTAFALFPEQPYPAQPDFLRKRVEGAYEGKYRVLGLSGWRFFSKGWSPTLANNYASVYGAMAFNGYDTFIGERSEDRQVYQSLLSQPLQTLREYGVRRVIIHKPFLNSRVMEWAYRLGGPLASALPVASPKVIQEGRLLEENDQYAVYDIEGAKPMAYPEGKEGKALPSSLKGSDVVVDTSLVSSGEPIILNFLRRHWTTVRSSTGERLPLSSDSWGRIRVVLDKPQAFLRLSYEPPWGLWGTASLIGALLLLALTYFVRTGRPTSSPS